MKEVTATLMFLSDPSYSVEVTFGSELSRDEVENKLLKVYANLASLSIPRVEGGPVFLGKNALADMIISFD